ncbi:MULTISPECIES: N-acetyltransferase [unclassified Chromobacterium]|uniref:GNAT family N-acetyltransferase n=1 Tax=unclassified Chromobacterium TaxID=2641838 RepID=UPI00065334C6|nr:N-acetyltransferase [Chromobacterium sp. LK1]KMN37601.1 hypothetical protein VI26_02945 [Chromobacterium sp. LK1]
MTARPAQLPDLAPVFQIEQAVFGQHIYPDFFFRQAHDLWPDLFLVAPGAQDGELGGYIIGAPGSGQGEFWIMSLAVHLHCRGQGTGKQLLQTLLQALRARQASHAKLTVHPDNPAVRLYQQLGFTIIEHQPHYFGEDEPRLLMRVDF